MIKALNMTYYLCMCLFYKTGGCVFFIKCANNSGINFMKHHLLPLSVSKACSLGGKTLPITGAPPKTYFPAQ